MSNRFALVAAAAAMTITVAAPVPASAGIFSSLMRVAAHQAQKAVVRAIKKELRVGGMRHGGRHMRVARF